MIATDDTTVMISNLPEWRETRLIALSHLIDLGGRNILRLIESVSDHEGSVTVTWQVEPTDEEKKWVAEKWGDVGEEPSCTYHIFKGEEI